MLFKHQFCNFDQFWKHFEEVKLVYHYFTVGTVLTPKLVLVLNQYSDYLHQVGFSLKSGFKDIVLTPKLVLVLNGYSQK